MKKVFLKIGSIALIVLFTASACNNSDSTATGEESSTTDTPMVVAPIDTSKTMMAESKDTMAMNPGDVKVEKVTEQKPAERGRDTVLIKTSMGDIVVVLYNETPLHRDNFLKLVKAKFYNGIQFHRVINNFMIQTGDPNSKDADPNNDGMGGPGYTIPAEINPMFKHKKGALAAARTENPEKASSGSQFYICHVPTPFLDGQYTVFGETIKGLEVVDKIATTPTSAGDRPVKPITIISMKWLNAPKKTK